MKIHFHFCLYCADGMDDRGWGQRKTSRLCELNSDDVKPFSHTFPLTHQGNGCLLVHLQAESVVLFVFQPSIMDHAFGYCLIHEEKTAGQFWRISSSVCVSPMILNNSGALVFKKISVFGSFQTTDLFTGAYRSFFFLSSMKKGAHWSPAPVNYRKIHRINQ